MLTLTIPDMVCGHCKASVEKAVASVAPSATVAIDLDTKRADVSGAGDADAVLGAIRSAGFEPALA
jgi:copper chaperone